MNRSRVLQTCRADGVLLKPDRPASAVDACFLRADPARCAGLLIDAAAAYAPGSGVLDAPPPSGMIPTFCHS